MKKYISIFFFLFFIYNLQSQVLIALLLGDKLNSGNIEFGIDGGLNYSTISGMGSNDWIKNWNLGFYFDIKIKDQWVFNTGVLVKSRLGIDELSDEDLQFLQTTIYDTEGIYSQEMDYFLVPALAKYNFKSHFFAEAGLQFGLMYNAWVEFNSNIEGNTAKITDHNEEMINRIDMGLAAGTGYRLLKGMGWTIGVRYYYGLINVYKDKPGTKNSALFLKMYIPIGASEETKEKVRLHKAAEKEKKEIKKAEKKKSKNL